MAALAVTAENPSVMVLLAVPGAVVGDGAHRGDRTIGQATVGTRTVAGRRHELMA